MPWKELESKGWIAEALCREVRVPLPNDLRLDYARAETRDKFRFAAENPAKADVVRRLVRAHAGEPLLLIGTYVDHIEHLGRSLGFPLVTGKTSQKVREKLFDDFRFGRAPALAVSKIGNTSLDLPDARVMVQVSGAFGSRQEEAQRLGRLLRPKAGRPVATFYTVVTSDTVEEEFARHRQLFLTEQGYRYEIETVSS